MKVAIVGSSGYIASYLRKDLLEKGHTVMDIGRSGADTEYLDLNQPEAFRYPVLETADFVVFTAAVSSPDQCASHYSQCWKVNVDGTAYFIRQALGYGCKVLFFSSDAVFGDMPGCIYTEESRTMAVTAYGEMKKAVEDKFKKKKGFKAIRLPYVVSKNDRFVTYCLDCARGGHIAEVYHPFYRNCIVMSDVVAAVAWLMDHFESFQPFALNVAGRELVSRIRIADELCWLASGGLEYIICRPESWFFKNRPMVTRMKSLYLDTEGVLAEGTFTEKFRREMEGVVLW